jgi:hypothetical protein
MREETGTGFRALYLVYWMETDEAQLHIDLLHN